MKKSAPSTAATMRARAAAYERWGREDGVAGTAKARSLGPGSLDYWLNRQPADLSANERRRRAESAKKAYYTRLSIASAKARASRKASK